jgi:hypothetical protein
LAVDPRVVAEIVPVIALIATFGMPVAIVFVVKHFKFKSRELEAEIEVRRMLSDRDKAELAARIERLENVLLGGARAPAQGALQQAQAPAALPASLPDFPEAMPSEAERAERRERER